MPTTIDTADDSLSLKDHEATFAKGRLVRPQAEQPKSDDPPQPGLDEAAQAAHQEDFLNSQDPMRRFRKADEDDKPRRHRAPGDRAKADSVLR